MENAARLPRHQLRVAIGCSYALIGIAWVLLLRHWTWSISIVRAEPEWYQSDYLPFWTGVLVFAVTALWIRLPWAWLYGLLITGPPYGWLLWLLTGAMRDVSADPTTIANARTMAVVAACLALSGAILNPLVAALVGMIKTRVRGITHQKATSP